MGMDPLTLGLGASAAAGLYGAISGNKQQDQNRQQTQQNFASQQAFQQDQQNRLDAHNSMLTQLIMPYLSQANGGSQAMNTGQDSLLQLMRGQGGAAMDALNRQATGTPQFDTSALFGSIKQMGTQDLNDQVAGLHASAGSLGQRFGSAMGANEAQLRARAATGMTGAYTQAGQSAFESAQNRQLQAGQGLAGIQLGAAGALNAQRSTQQNYMAQLLGMLSGQQANIGGQAPQQQILNQENQLPGAISDVGNMAMFYPFLKQLMAGGGAGAGAASPGAFTNYSWI